MRFSISVPVGSWTPQLRFALRSLARQRPRPAVALLDASGDTRVAALADAFDDLLAYRRHGPDEGQAAAILEGWERAPGDVLGWLNADDFLAPDALARAAEALERADVAFGHSVVLSGEDAIMGWHPAVSGELSTLMRACPVSQPSCFFKRAATEAAGGLDPTLAFTMDWDLWKRLALAQARFGFVDAALSAVHWGRQTKTASLGSGRLREIARVLRRTETPLTTAKSLSGFLIHTISHYVLPAGMARPIRRLGATLLGPRAPTPVHGVGSSGRLGERGDLPLFHERDAPAVGLLVHVAQREGAGWLRWRLEDAAGRVLDEAISQPGGAVRLDGPIPAGQAFALRFERRGVGPFWLNRVEWASDPRRIAAPEAL